MKRNVRDDDEFSVSFLVLILLSATANGKLKMPAEKFYILGELVQTLQEYFTGKEVSDFDCWPGDYDNWNKTTRAVIDKIIADNKSAFSKTPFLELKKLINLHYESGSYGDHGGYECFLYLWVMHRMEHPFGCDAFHLHPHLGDEAREYLRQVGTSHENKEWLRVIVELGSIMGKYIARDVEGLRNR